MKNDYQPHTGARRNTSPGFIDLHLWHGQKVRVRLDSVNWFAEHDAGKGNTGCRVNAGGETLYVAENFDYVALRMVNAAVN